jgi:hypothetical protein
MQTKNITDIGTETASCKVLPLGNKWTVYASLSATPPTLLITLPFASSGRGTHRFVPTTVNTTIL